MHRTSSDSFDIDFELPEEVVGVLQAQFLRFGDFIQLFSISKYVVQQEPSYVATSFGRPSHSGGYIGVYTKLDGSQKVAIPPLGDTPGHFQESTFEVLYAPACCDRLGHRVKYGDAVVLVDQHGKVWNNKSTDSVGWGHALGLGSSKGFFEGYLCPKRRGVEGELFVTFRKRGREGKGVLYGDHGVFIDVLDSHRNSTAYNYRLTNYKSTNSKCLGGYVCCHGYGHEMSISVHAANDSPGLHFLSQTTLLRSQSSSERVSEAPTIENVQVCDTEKQDVMIQGPKYDQPFYVYTHIDHGETVIIQLSDGATAALDVAEMRQCKLKYLMVEQPAVENDGQRRRDMQRPTKQLNKLQVSWENVVEDGSQLSIEQPWRLDSHSRYYLSLLKDAVELVFCYTYFGFLLPYYCYVGAVTPPTLVNRADQYPGYDDKRQKSKWRMKVSVADDCFDQCEEKLEDTSSQEALENDDGMVEAKIPAEPCAWRNAGESDKGVPNHPAFQRFLRGENGVFPSALARWKTSMTWREELSVDSILQKPHRKFEVIKRFYPHYYLGRSRERFPIYVEKPGMIDLDALKLAGVTADDLLWHSVFLAEYQWTNIEPDETSQTAKSISILDMNGIGFSDLAGDAVAFMRKAISIAQDHYPERSKSIYLLNVPYWFDIVMKIVRQFISPATLEKIHIFRYGFQSKLLEEIDKAVLPKHYGGESLLTEDETVMEIRLRKLVYERLVDEELTLIDDQGHSNPDSIQEMKSYLSKFASV